MNTITTASNASAIIPFNFEGTAVRVLDQSGEPWWVLADVCKVLEIANAPHAASRLDDDEKTTIANNDSQAGSGAQAYTIINESGLWSLVLTSRKAAAKRFKKWITSEVIPSIRKTGSYSISYTPKPKRIRKPPMLATFKTGYGIAKELGLDDNQAASHAGRYCLNKCGENPLPALGLDSRPTPTKVNYYNVTELGKELGVSGQAMNKLLIEHGYQVKVHGGSSSAPYEPTEKGKPHARLFDEVRKGSRGSQQVLKWKHVIVSLLHPFTKAPA